MAEAHSLYETMGLVRIVETDPEGRATLEYEAKREQCHSGGVVQGGFISGLASSRNTSAHTIPLQQDFVHCIHNSSLLQ